MRGEGSRRLHPAIVAAALTLGTVACGERVRTADEYIADRAALKIASERCEREGFGEADARNPVTSFQRDCFNAGVALVRIRTAERDAARKAARQADADYFSGDR